MAGNPTFQGQYMGQAPGAAKAKYPGAPKAVNPNPTYAGSSPATAPPPAQQGGLGGGAQPTVQPTSPPAATTAPAQVTVPFQDQAYYDQLARLNFSYQNVLAEYNRGLQEDQAAYNNTYGALTRALPLQLQATRNAANKQGLLESGYDAQRQGLDQATYFGKVGSAQARLQQQQQSLQDMLSKAYDAMQLGDQNALDAALARFQKAQEAVSPTTPPVTGTVNAAGGGGPVHGRARVGHAPVRRAGVSGTASLRRTASRRVA